MKKILRILCIISFLTMSFYPLGFSQYAELVGKRVEIHGPFCWDRLAVALDEETCDELIYILHYGSKNMFLSMLHFSSTRVLGITKNTRAVVLDVELFEGRAKVALLSGVHRGMSGWIPIEWLRNNEERPRLSDNSQR